MKPSSLDKSYQGAVIIQIKIDPWNEYLHGNKNTADQDSRYKNLALSTKQKQCMKVGSKLYRCCK